MAELNPIGGLRLANVGQPRRVARHPQHPFNLETRPWQIQPFLCAPVLPGETMKNLLLQARVLSDPIKNPLIGWWCEHYFFYVKHRDLHARETLSQMMVDPSTSTAALQSSTGTDGPKYYFVSVGTKINWMKLCLQRVVEDYFRMEGESWNGFVIDEVPLSSIAKQDWLDSAMNDTERMSADVDVDGPDANTTVQASEVDIAMRTWQFLRAEGLTQMTYEDYLRSYGVRKSLAKEENHMPELIRNVRDWTYPSSYVEPTTGVPSAAVSWKVAERADKDRYFPEPGFILGVQCVRPKVYISGQTASAIQLMESALTWLPAVMRDDVLSSWVKVSALTAPLPTNTDAYWVDIKDLLLYGEQFFNYAAGTAERNHIGLPAATLQKRYADATKADALFKSAAPANKIRTDGVVSLSILGALQDTSLTR